MGINMLEINPISNAGYVATDNSEIDSNPITLNSENNSDISTIQEKCDKYLLPIKSKPPFIDIENYWSDLELRQEDVDKMADAEFLIPNILVRGHVAVYIAKANGGKTTLFKYFCEGLTEKKLNVFYINVDGNPDDLKRHFAHATKFGYKVIAPDSRDSKNTGDALAKLKELSLSDSDLSNHVYIIDTIKKFVDLMNKSQLKERLQMFRKLSVKGATVVLLGHANKFENSEGNLVYEGTADLRNDVDELIYILYSKDDINKTQDLTTQPDKVRARFEPVSYRILFDQDRKVIPLNEVQKILSQNDKELIGLITAAIANGDDTQTQIIKYVSERTAIGKVKIREFLIKNSKAGGDVDYLWISTPTGSNNAFRYSMKPTEPIVPPTLFSLLEK